MLRIVWPLITERRPINKFCVFTKLSIVVQLYNGFKNNVSTKLYWVFICFMLLSVKLIMISMLRLNTAKTIWLKKCLTLS